MPRRLLAAAVVAFGSVAAGHALAYHEAGQEWVNATAYTLRGGEFSLGIFQWQAGVLDELTIGTFPALWAASPFVEHAVPNGYFKLRDWLHGPLAVSLRGTALYVDGSTLVERYSGSDAEQADLLVIGGNLAASYRSQGAWSFSPELAYSYVNLAGDSTDIAVEGAAAASTLRAGFLAEWRFTRFLALHLTSRVLLYREEFSADSEFEPDDSTQVRVELHEEHPAPVGAWNIVPSIALSGKHVNFSAGLGYGYGWLPVVGIVSDQPGFILNFDFFVRFQPF